MSQNMRETTCKHYRGCHHNECCEKGINLRQHVGGPDYGWAARLPCFEMSHTDKSEVVPCQLFELRTPAEIEAEEREIAELFGRTDKARSAIVEHLGGPWKRGMPSVSGKIECPICECGELRFSRAGYNGHIHAACTTENCVRWME